MLGISLAQLAKSIGVTFQQIQKYECGANRVGSSRLWELSRALLCPVSFFFEGMDERTANASPRHLSAGKADFAPRLQLEDTTTDRETVRLVRAYLTIKDINARQGVIELVKSLSPPMGVAPDPYDPERTTAPEAEVTATYVA